MGKGDIKKESMYMCLVWTGKCTPLFATGDFIFKIPISTDLLEMKEILYKQVYIQFCRLSEVSNGNFTYIQKTILAWLKQLTARYPGTKQWVEDAANAAAKKAMEDKGIKDTRIHISLKDVLGI